MTKNNMWDNTNLQQDIQWGNIELKGLPDEKLLTTNWNHLDAVRQRDSDPQYHNKRTQALKKVQNTSSWRDNIAQANKLKAQDPEWRRRHQASYNQEINQQRSISVRSAYANNPQLSRDATDRTKKLWQDQEHRQRIQQCVKTSLGVFESFKAAAMAFGITKGAFSNKFKREQIKNPKLWKLLTYEQYLRLSKKK